MSLAVAASLAGCATVPTGPSFILLWPFLTADGAPAVLEMVRQHARRIVYLSSSGVRDNLEPQTDAISQFHADVERLIEPSGLERAFLRSGGFATNALWWAAADPWCWRRACALWRGGPVADPRGGHRRRGGPRADRRGLCRKLGIQDPAVSEKG